MSERPLTANIRPGAAPMDLEAYRAAGGYQAVRRALLTMTPTEVVDEVTRAKLRGRGGAGFGTGQKWSFVPKKKPGQRSYLVANADEMEPGTFKDRLLLEGDPHQMVEAVIVSAYAIGATDAYIFVRGEYRVAIQRLTRAIAEAEAAGLVGNDILGSGYSLALHIHGSAGRYICGEETALLTALEGRRALPRSKPPFPQVSGLWGAPSVVNNVETLCNVPHIVNRGAEWFQGLGIGPDAGTKLYGFSGHVKRPGTWELPIGTPLREILEEHAGGMQDGYECVALLPGGASTGFMGADQLDTPMDYGSVERAGSRLGTGAAIMLDQKSCPVGMVRNLEHFFAQESCGWCTPCRDGLPWVERILAALEDGEGEDGDIEQLERHVGLLGMGRTFCAHAPGAMAPLDSALKRFRPEFERHVHDRHCSWR
jgi:NADH-quinone oxidoreductase subunit F